MAKEKNPAFGEKIITGVARASFPKLAEPDNSKFGQGKYGVDAIFEDPKELAGLKAKCEAHAREFYKVKDVSEIKFPWRDGGELAKYSGYEGNEFIRCRSKNEPTVVDQNKKSLDAKKIYGGCNIRLNVTPLAYEKDEEVVIIENGKKRTQKTKVKGVTCLLNAVQFVGDNDRFGNGGGGDGGFDDSYATDDTNDGDAF